MWLCMLDVYVHANIHTYHYKHILKQTSSVNRPRKLKFLNPKKNSLSLYKKKLAPRAPGTLTDMYGFVCSHEEYLLEKEFYRVYSGIRKQRDHEWVEYLKSIGEHTHTYTHAHIHSYTHTYIHIHIGGAENLKPAGVYKPSKDLKQMCRQGIPVAYRCLVWQKISMSSLYKLHYPANYYASLVSNIHTLKDKKVFTDIEKDVDRTFPEHAFFAPGGEGEFIVRFV
ncbi:hypothetical protein EON63_10305 [archaeon]|nr:MAG: hypothetical protein EON63_10305 [archaeon]